MAKLRKIVGMFLRKSLPILAKRVFVRGYSFRKMSHLQSGLLKKLFGTGFNHFNGFGKGDLGPMFKVETYFQFFNYPFLN